MVAFSTFSSYSVVLTDEWHGGRGLGTRHQTCWHAPSFLHNLLCLQMSGMEGGMLEGGGGGLDNQMGRLTLSSEDLSNKNRENGSPYDNKVCLFFYRLHCCERQ